MWWALDLETVEHCSWMLSDAADQVVKPKVGGHERSRMRLVFVSWISAQMHDGLAEVQPCGWP
jgi:hypothetical protein